MGAFREFLTDTTKTLSELDSILAKANLHLDKTNGSQMWYIPKNNPKVDRVTAYNQVNKFLKSRVGEPTAHHSFETVAHHSLICSVWLITNVVAVAVVYDNRTNKPELELVEIEDR